MTITEICQHACPTSAEICGVSSEDVSVSTCSAAPRALHVPHQSSHADHATLADMLTCAQRGDEQAFAQVYQHTSSAVFGALLRIVNHRAEAEDLLQDVYMALWQRRLVFDAQRGDVLPWLLTVARHRAISYLRKRQHATLDDSLMSSLPSDAESPPDVHEKKHDRQRLALAMATLSAQQRQAITIAYFGGFTYSELAQTLGVPEGTVKSWIRRGLARLRAMLEY